MERAFAKKAERGLVCKGYCYDIVGGWVMRTLGHVGIME